MHIKINFFLLVFAFFLTQLYSQKIKIFGNSPDYAGKIIYPYLLADGITSLEEEFGKFKVDSQGQFQFEIELNETQKIFLPLGGIKGYIFVEPYHNYEIVLPPYTNLELKDRLNPFFKAIETQIGIINSWTLGIKDKDSDELNYLINSFEVTFNEYLNQIIQQNIIHKKSTDSDSIISEMIKISNQYDNSFFRNYVFYKTGILKYNALLKPNNDLFISEYFQNRDVLYNNPAYIELFHTVFDKYIYNNLNDNKNRIAIEIALYEHNYHKLLEAFKINDNRLDNAISEFVLLKEIHDGLYSKDYPSNLLLQMIDSLYFSSQIPENKFIAQNIREKVTRLLPGYYPPSFSLIGDNNIIYSPDDFKGKYLYLNFINIQSLACVKDFEILNQLQDKYNEHLAIVSICTDEYFENTLIYKQKKNLNWIFLYYGGNSSILKKYSIKAFPTYYLIDPEGKLLLSPAPTPEEDFEKKFYQILKSKRLI